MPPRLAGAAVTQHDRSAITLTHTSRGSGRDVLPDALLGWINTLSASALQGAVSPVGNAEHSAQQHFKADVPCHLPWA